MSGLAYKKAQQFSPAAFKANMLRLFDELSGNRVFDKEILSQPELFNCTPVGN